MGAKKWRYTLWIIEKRKDIRLRQDPAELFDNFLATSHPEQPVMDDGAPHHASPRWSDWLRLFNFFTTRLCRPERAAR
jgi:hypothetical protein